MTYSKSGNRKRMTYSKSSKRERTYSKSSNRESDDGVELFLPIVLEC